MNQNSKLELSVVICVSDDVRVDKTLKSIKDNCEVIIVLNQPTNEVKSIVTNYKNNGIYELNIYEISEKNLSKARNVGTNLAKYDKVVFFDSDCVITKGSLQIYNVLLDEFLLVDGKVKFRDDNFQSKIISKVREYGIPGYALCPSMGLNKKILEYSNGYFFDEDIKWVEDTELNDRVKNKIKIGRINQITCIHDNLTFKLDLKSGYKYGTGVRRAVNKKIYKPGPEPNWFLFKELAKENLISALYFVIWNGFYCLGYYTEKEKKNEDIRIKRMGNKRS
ncbi:MAG: glycosyltransferase family 2 protein [Bacilli bacterium]|nr:glycosyltransferase family 2 protein [Bacilli bacterium]